MEDKTYLKRRRIIAVVSVLSLILFTLIGTAILTKPIVEFLGEPEEFRKWAESGHFGELSLLLIMIVQVIISLIPGGVIELAAGYCYGGIMGALICVAGAAVGGGIVFSLVKKFGTPLAEAFISREKLNSLSFLRDAKKLNSLTFILYLIPGTPKDLFNYFLGLTSMKLSTFLIICTVARIPAILMTTVCGDAIINGEYLKAAAVFTLTALCSIGGMIIYRFVFEKRNKN